MVGLAKGCRKRREVYSSRFCCASARLNPFIEAGFTLIEVLVSVVILSVGIVTILVALESSVRALDEARNAMWSYRTASDLLEEARLAFAAGTGPGIGMTSGMRISPHGNYRWEIRVMPASSSGGAGDGGELMQVTATVWREGGTGRRSVTTTMGPRPEKEGSSS